jgi:hypothetical protein
MVSVMSFPEFTARVLTGLALGACIVCTLPSDAGTNCESIYRLTEKATYQEGCFPPCMCPMMVASGIRGTFVMGPATAGDTFFSHEVLYVNWIVTLDDAEFEITGSGTYQISNGPQPWVHALDLNLSVDGGETQHFFSGFVPLTSNDVSINIPISIKGQFCYDTVIVVNASPVTQDSILHYRLAGDSTYQRGCFDPCDCPIEKPRQLHGTFTLVPVLEHGTYVEYAVPWARFFEPPLNNVSEEIRLTGFGTYTLAQGFAGPAHQLDLRLRTSCGEVERFGSALMNTDPSFPAEIDIVVDKNDQICLDTVLSIHAIWSGAMVFRDDFECGDRTAWSSSTGP